MAALIESVSSSSRRQASTTFGDWLGLFTPDNLAPLLQTTQPNIPEQIDPHFTGYVTGLLLRNSVVFACLALRARLFSEARFQFQQLRAGQPGRLFSTPDLAVLERPQPGWSTRDLLQMAMLDADLAGAAFPLADGGRIRRLRPDWVTIARGSKRHPDQGSWAYDAEIIGYGYHAGGLGMGQAPDVFLAEQVAFFAPTKNPLTGSGVSLLTAAVREVLADNAATTHKLSFLTQAATPNLALKFPPTMSKDKALEWIELFEQEHRGATNAWRTVYLGAGVEPVPVGLNFLEMDFAKLQGRMETRIASLTGMHPVVVAVSEALSGSSLSEGNYGAARRNVGDTTLRPLWGDVSSSFETIVPPIGGSRLWFDDRQIAFLRDDVKDQAEIMQKDMASLNSGITQGWEPDAVLDAVIARDLGRLANRHTGLVSVQLQPPGATLDGSAAPPGDQAAIAGVFRTVAGQPLPRIAAIASTYRSRVEFEAIDEPFRSLGLIPRGATVPGDHPVVREFPALFEPVPDSPPMALLPARTVSAIAPIVTRDEVLTKREELSEAGLPHGYDALAEALGVSRATIRRRLAERDQDEPHDAMASAIGALAAAVAGRPDQAPTINVHGAPVTVEAPSPTPVVIEPGAVQVHTIVEAPPATVINVEPGPAPNVTVEAPPPAQVNVTIPEPKAVRRRIERDATGRASGIIEEPADD